MRLPLLPGVLLTTLLWLFGCAAQAPPLPPIHEPEELRNPLAGFQLRLWSEQTPLLIDSLLDLKLQASAPVYLSLYAIHSSGTTARLLADRQVLANRTLLYPEPHVPLDLRLSPPTGTEIFILVGTLIPLNWPETTAPPAGNTPILALDRDRQGLLDGLQQVLRERDRQQWNVAVLRLPLEGRVVWSTAEFQPIKIIDGVVQAQHLRGVGGESLL